jgi:hypothetical protein
MLARRDPADRRFGCVSFRGDLGASLPGRLEGLQETLREIGQTGSLTRCNGRAMGLDS